jgi:EAL domain-containing protein (putative c-di-GMP-specific phosphodiesterase class I)
MRWEVASPDRFIPVAEDSGLIVPMTDELISMVCRDVPRLRAVVPELTIFINISARHIGKLDLVSRLTHHLGGCNFDSSVLGVEITETSFFSNDSLVPGVIRELSEAGFSVAIDDFGTGYSSLSYLKRLQVDRIKIDRSFVADLPGSHADGALVDSVVTLGRRLNKIVVAEGVETEEQHRYLLAKGADFFQGYYFSPAIPAEKFTAGVAAARELDT